MTGSIVFTKTAIETVVKKRSKSSEKKNNYVDLIEKLFIKLLEVGDTATFEVDNVNSFKTAYYRLRGHRNHSVKMKRKQFLIRDSETLKPIRSGESRPARIDFILVEDKSQPMKRITLAEQFPDMTEEQINNMLNRREE